MKRSKSNCWWISTWWWGVATVRILFSSTGRSSERCDKPRATWQNIIFWFFIKVSCVITFWFVFLFQGDCWICMELMSTSLDKFYKYVYCAFDDVIPEEILGKITLAVSRAWRFILCVFLMWYRAYCWNYSWGFCAFLTDRESTEPLKGKLENNSQRWARCLYFMRCA